MSPDPKAHGGLAGQYLVERQIEQFGQARGLYKTGSVPRLHLAQI